MSIDASHEMMGEKFIKKWRKIWKKKKKKENIENLKVIEIEIGNI